MRCSSRELRAALATFNGFLSASFTSNQSNPDSGRNALRVFDYQDRRPQIDDGELVVQHAVSKPNDFGFRVDFLAGSTAPEMTAAYGLFRDKSTGKPSTSISPKCISATSLRWEKGCAWTARIEMCFSMAMSIGDGSLPPQLT